MSILQFPLGSDFNNQDSIMFIPKKYSANGGGKKSNVVIQLLMPQELETTYEHKWDSSELSGILSSVLDGSGKGFMAGLAEGAVAVGKLVGEGAIKKIEIKNGLAHNNRIALAYSGTGLRTFSFSFNMLPETKDESFKMLEIIQQFKFHSSTESDLSSPTTIQTDNAGEEITLSYPDLWDIVLNPSGSGVKFSPFKIGAAACTSVKVNYAPSGVMNKFQGTDIPTHILLTVDFTELVPVSRSSNSTTYNSSGDKSGNNRGFGTVNGITDGNYQKLGL